MMGEVALACSLLLSDVNVGDRFSTKDAYGSKNLIVTSVEADGFTYDLDPPVDEHDIWAGQPVTLLAKGRRAIADKDDCILLPFSRQHAING